VPAKIAFLSEAKNLPLLQFSNADFQIARGFLVSDRRSEIDNRQ